MTGLVWLYVIVLIEIYFEQLNGKLKCNLSYFNLPRTYQAFLKIVKLSFTRFYVKYALKDLSKSY